MGLFENYPQEAEAIEKEIERKGVVLGIDWGDEAQVRALAREALLHGRQQTRDATVHPADRMALARAELFGLAALMLKTMEQSAGDGLDLHGGLVWKAFGRALWRESEAMKAGDA